MTLYGAAILPVATEDIRTAQISLLTGTDRPGLAQTLDKLVQQVVFLLLTEEDSIEGMPGFGAGLTNEIGQLVIQDKADLDTQLSGASQKILEQLNSLVNQNTPDTDRLRSLEIISTDLNRETGEAEVQITLQPVEGDSQKYTTRIQTS